MMIFIGSLHNVYYTTFIYSVSVGTAVGLEPHPIYSSPSDMSSIKSVSVITELCPYRIVYNARGLSVLRYMIFNRVQ